MKNLKVLYVQRRSFDYNDLTDLLLSSGNNFFSFNSLRETYFCANSCGIYQLGEKIEAIFEWPGHFRDDELVSFDFISDDFRFCALFRSGKVLLIDLENNEVEPFNLNVTEVLSGTWAPDFHALVVNTQTKLKFFTREFELLHEDELVPSSAGREELVALGWGSRETQFQGVDSRKRMQEEVAEVETAIFSYDEGAVAYCWSGDAKFLAVSCVNPLKNSRNVFIWNDEGELISRMEAVEGAERPIAYKPSGSLVAVCRSINGVSEIVLFERNGKKRSQFPISDDPKKRIFWLQWNTDSTVLAVHVVSSKKTLYEIQYWCRSNYKWQMKYCFRSKDVIHYTSWHCEHPMIFHLLTASAGLVTISFELVYDIEDMNVIFLDAPNTACFTDLCMASLPPPMSHYVHQFPDAVCEVAQSAFGAVFLLANRQLFFFSRADGRYCLSGQRSLETAFPYSFCCYNLQHDGSDKVSLIVSALEKKCSYSLVEICVDNSDECNIIYQSSVPLLWHCRVGNEVVVQALNNEWFFVSVDGKQITRNCEWMLFGAPKNERLYDCRLLPKLQCVVGLTRDNVLLVNGKEFCANVGSYSVDDEFLIFLTLPSSDTVYRIHALEVQNLTEIHYPYVPSGGRTIERGAAIVGHENKGTRVWLQMPRGNLETIHLRHLVLRALKRCFASKSYKEALNLMRKHRIDMNLVFDHDPESFLHDVSKFIDDLYDADLLNLFILSLNGEDSTKTLYSQYYLEKSVKDRLLFPNKVNKICEALQEHLLSMGINRLSLVFTCLLSTYIKMEPNKIAEALLAIRHYATEIEDGQRMKGKWLDYISILMPNENLFKEALAIYDLELAAEVAQYSHLDPKEYLAVLTNFHAKTPLFYQQFCIDVWLGRYETALCNIASVPERFEEAKAFIEQHQLYTVALRSYCGRPCYLDICILCAKYMFTKHFYKEAGLLFLRASQYEDALLCAERCGDWEVFSRIASKAKVTGLDMVSRLERMADFLERNGKHLECAHLLMTLNRKEDSLRVLKALSAAGDWKSFGEFATTEIEFVEVAKNILYNHKTTWLNNISEWKQAWDKNFMRLNAIREDKRLKLQNIIETGITEVDETASEMFSETSSVSTGISKMSSKTSASSRNRKRRERKKMSLKVGSQFEDAAILGFLKTLIERVYSMRDSVKEAAELQRCFAELFRYFTDYSAKIWPSVIQPHMLLGPISEIYRCDDGIIRYCTESSMPPRVILDLELSAPSVSYDETWMLDVLR